jgi:hypothetical protein
VVVVVAAIARKGGTQLLVAPITHVPPERATDAIELPAIVKQQVGLDSARSWIVLTELNGFIWPGPDIRIAPGHQSPVYDAIPDWLFFDVRKEILRHSSAGKLKVTKRTE